MPKPVIPPPQERSEKCAPRTPSLPNEFHYVPVSDELREWECYLTAVGSQAYPPGTRYPCPGHPAMYDFAWRAGRVLPEYAVVLIAEGSGEYEFRNCDIQNCAKGDVLLIAPGQWHRYRPSAATGWTEIWICLSGEYLYRLRSKQLIFDQHCLPLGEHFEPVRVALADVLRVVREGKHFNSSSLTGKALEIIIRIAQSAGERSTGKTRQHVWDVPDTVVARALEFVGPTAIAPSERRTLPGRRE